MKQILLIGAILAGATAPLFAAGKSLGVLKCWTSQNPDFSYFFSDIEVTLGEVASSLNPGFTNTVAQAKFELQDKKYFEPEQPSVNVVTTNKVVGSESVSLGTYENPISSYLFYLDWEKTHLRLFCGVPLKENGPFHCQGHGEYDGFKIDHIVCEKSAE